MLTKNYIRSSLSTTETKIDTPLPLPEVQELSIAELMNDYIPQSSLPKLMKFDSVMQEYFFIC